MTRSNWMKLRLQNGGVSGKKIQPVTGHHILFNLKRTLNYDGCVAITEGQAFDLTSLLDFKL